MTSQILHHSERQLIPNHTLWLPHRRRECLKSLTRFFVRPHRGRRIIRSVRRMRHKEGSFGVVGEDFWPQTGDDGGSSVSGTRVVTATLPVKWIEVAS